MTIIKTHGFQPKAFRRLRLPILILALIPSLVLDGFILYGFGVGMAALAPLIQASDLQATLSGLAATFVLLQLEPIMVYLRVWGQRARSVVRETDQGVVYRKCKLMGFLKTDWKTGCAYNDDIELSHINSLRQTATGSIVVQGAFKIVRRLPETEALYGERATRRIVIPGYFADMDGITERLKRDLK